MGYVIAVAEFVAALDGAVFGVRAGPPATLALVCFGGLFVVLWAGRGRWAGLAPIALGLVLWTADDRPALLVADTGRLFGIRTDAGRILSSDRGNGFAAETWLGNDGDRASQAEAHARGGLKRRHHRIEADLPGLGPVIYVGSKDEAGAASDCAIAAVLIAPNWARPPEGRCLFIGAERLAREGALAIRPDATGMRIEGAKARNRARPWTRDPGDWD
jgi:competence protein ComEC